jgi:hypothetical protein
VANHRVDILQTLENEAPSIQLPTVSTKRLSRPLKTLVHELSLDIVPTNIHEALANPKWTQAVKEEMEALQKNGT